mmetsp:Transcript_51195/g.150862  ORF Transcript_51195/g.150862 Transcript_51195/m.150862 type:complete len:206 (-) Transcript_51195:78-695(-)
MSIVSCRCHKKARPTKRTRGAPARPVPQRIGTGEVTSGNSSNSGASGSTLTVGMPGEGGRRLRTEASSAHTPPFSVSSSILAVRTGSGRSSESNSSSLMDQPVVPVSMIATVGAPSATGWPLTTSRATRHAYLRSGARGRRSTIGTAVPSRRSMSGDRDSSIRRLRKSKRMLTMSVCSSKVGRRTRGPRALTSPTKMAPDPPFPW